MPASDPIDAQTLRAIAHPLRQRILDELSAQGSMRAADVARELDVPANQASFHLRQLAKYGLVVEDADAARDRRDRVWKRAQRDLTIALNEVEVDDAGRAAADVFRRQRGASAHYIVERAYAMKPSGQKNSVTTVDETALRLTKDEVHELTDELEAVVRRFAAHTRAADDGVERRTYVHLAITTPRPPAPPSASGSKS